MLGNPFDLGDEPKSENKPAPDPFGRLGEDEEPDIEIADIKNPTELKSSVGDSGQNSRRDVAKTEQLLGKAGTLDLKKTDGPTGYWGMRTSDATKAFQKKNGLKVDGQINTGGETIRALGKLVGQAVKSASQRSKSYTVIPAKAGTHTELVSSWVPGQARDDKDRGVIDRYKLTEGAFSENQRAARYLASRNGIGEFAKFVADGIETDGDKAIAETVDLYRQTLEFNPKQADALIKKVIPDLSEEHAQRLQSVLSLGDYDDSETISIGVWPDGQGPSGKPEKPDPSKDSAFGDSATDDETSEDDNPKFSRDWRDEALQHLIEGGLDPESAKKFLDMLPTYVKEEPSTFVDALTSLSGKLIPDEPSRHIPFPSIGGTRK